MNIQAGEKRERILEQTQPGFLERLAGGAEFFMCNTPVQGRMFRGLVSRVVLGHYIDGTIGRYFFAQEKGHFFTPGNVFGHYQVTDQKPPVGKVIRSNLKIADLALHLL